MRTTVRFSDKIRNLIAIYAQKGDRTEFLSKLVEEHHERARCKVERTVHEMKCWPESFTAIVAGEKLHEVRLDDRGYKVGDLLRLAEWYPTNKDATRGKYTGRKCSVLVTYVSKDKFGLPPGLAVMSIKLEAMQ